MIMILKPTRVNAEIIVNIVKMDCCIVLNVKEEYLGKKSIHWTLEIRGIASNALIIANTVKSLH